jgi:hypothetical protein
MMKTGVISKREIKKSSGFGKLWMLGRRRSTGAAEGRSPGGPKVSVVSLAAST